jgi:hypothetical protein
MYVMVWYGMVWYGMVWTIIVRHVRARHIRAILYVIHLAWICKMTSECNKYAFSTLSEVVIQDLRVIIRDLQVVIQDLQRKMFGL